MHNVSNFLQNLRFVSAMIIEFRFFNRIKKKKKNMKFYEYYTHTTSNYIKTFMVIFTLMIVDESENWNFLKYGTLENDDVPTYPQY